MYPDSPILRRALYLALQSALGLSDAEANACLFRGYSDNPPAEPAPSRNVCYYHLQSDSQASVLRETKIKNNIPQSFSFISCKILLVFYGPDCEAWAHRAVTFLFLDGAGKPRQILRNVGLYLVPVTDPPSVLYEEEGKTHRKRADLTVHARLVNNTDYAPVLAPDEPIPVNTVSETPDVSVHVSEIGH